LGEQPSGLQAKKMPGAVFQPAAEDTRPAEGFQSSSDLSDGPDTIENRGPASHFFYNFVEKIPTFYNIVDYARCAAWWPESASAFAKRS